MSLELHATRTVTNAAVDGVMCMMHFDSENGGNDRSGRNGDPGDLRSRRTE